MRNYSSNEYKKWRIAVRKRDKNKCKICGSTLKTQVHHIKPYALFPTLRYNISNGILLCKKHHKNMWEREEEFESKCLSLINPPRASIEDILKEYENREDESNG